MPKFRIRVTGWVIIEADRLENALELAKARVHMRKPEAELLNEVTDQDVSPDSGKHGQRAVI